MVKPKEDLSLIERQVLSDMASRIEPWHSPSLIAHAGLLVVNSLRKHGLIVATEDKEEAWMNPWYYVIASEGRRILEENSRQDSKGGGN